MSDPSATRRAAIAALVLAPMLALAMGQRLSGQSAQAGQQARQFAQAGQETLGQARPNLPVSAEQPSTVAVQGRPEVEPSVPAVYPDRVSGAPATSPASAVAKPVAEQTGLQASDPQIVLATLTKMGDEARARRDFETADEAYQSAMAMAFRQGLRAETADQYANLGHLSRDKGDTSEARSYWRAARDQYEQFGFSAKATAMTELLRQLAPPAAQVKAKPAPKSAGARRTAG